MENRTRYRLIGSMVFIVIVIVTIPLLLIHHSPLAEKDVPLVTTSTVSITIPAADKHSPQTPLPANFAVTTLQPHSENNNPKTTSPSPAEKPTATPIKINHPPTTPRNRTGQIKKSLVENKGTQIWTIQLGSFDQKNNAEMLVKKLRDAGFTAYIHEPGTQGYITRVFVGPESDKMKAEAMVKQLEQKFRLKGVLVSYKVDR